MKPTNRMAGTWVPTVEMVGPSPEVSVYAGAIHETPMTVAPMIPIWPVARPLAERPRSGVLPDGAELGVLRGGEVLTRYLFRFRSPDSKAESETARWSPLG